MKDMKFCRDCVSKIDAKPLPRCNASRFFDFVTGDDKRLCLFERLDGIGRCGSMANNFTLKKPEEKKKPGRPKKDD